MRKNGIMVLVAAASVVLTGAVPPNEVLDGDTIRLDGVLWRLYGFDAPEIRSGPGHCPEEKQLGEKAKTRLEQLIRDGYAHGGITITPVSRTKDKYGRLIGTLLVGGREVGAILIAEGLAKPYSGKGPKPNWCPAAATAPPTPAPQTLMASPAGGAACKGLDEAACRKSGCIWVKGHAASSGAPVAAYCRQRAQKGTISAPPQ